MAIKFNESGLRTAISQNKSAASNLEVAKNALSNINMPENFSSSYKLRNIPFRIERVKKSVEGINSFIEGKIDEYKVAQSKANESASLLSGLLSKFGFGKDRTSPNMMNNPDYEYYTKTQAKNTTANNQNLFPYLDASLEQKYFKTMAQMRQTKTSSLTNLTIGVLKGMAKAGETTIKGYQVGQANSISINNPDWNYYANGDKNKINDYARPYKQETMSKVSKKYIQSLYNGFYNTKIGKELNNTAAAPFKTDGAVTKFAENMAYRATIMAAGRVPIGAGFLGFLSGKGEATQSYWSQTKIQSQIKQGKNIDNIFDIGNTYGNAKGVTQGGSMAFQKATGARGIVDEILNKPWKRIVADAIAGGAETVAVAKANSIINGKGFKKTFEQMGGWKNVGASAATAGAISALGEFARWGLGKLASGKNDTTTIKKETIEKYEAIRTNDGRIANIGLYSDDVQMNEEGQVIYDTLDFREKFFKEHLQEVEKTIYSPSDALFIKNAKSTGDYGKDQNITHDLFDVVDSKGIVRKFGARDGTGKILNDIGDLEVIPKDGYEELKTYLTSGYNMSYDDAEKTIAMINSYTGVCPYARMCNNADQLKANDLLQNEGLIGSKSKDAMQLSDSYIFFNHEENNGKIFRENNGRTEIIEGAIEGYSNGLALDKDNLTRPNGALNTETEKEYLSALRGGEETELNSWTCILKGQEEWYTKNMQDAQKALKEGNGAVSLNIGDVPVNIATKNNNEQYAAYSQVRNHTVTVTGITKQGMVVAGWGERQFILHHELINNDEARMIINVNEKGK